MRWTRLVIGTAVAVSVSLTASGCNSNGAGSTAEDDSAAPPATTGGTTSDASTETYRSHTFLGGGAEVTLEDGWTITEDSAGHLAAAEAEDPDYRVMFSLDPYPIEGGERVEGEPETAAGLLDALRSNPNLDLGEVSQESIGGTIPAVAADVSASAEAVNDDPGSPENVCVNFVAFPPAEGYGPAGDDVYRLYIADLADGEQSRLLMVSVEAKDAPDLEEFLPAAERIISSARIAEDSEG